MKKEYKKPMLSMVNANAENQILAGSQGYTHPDAKQSGRIYDDEEAAPVAPKKFWDDEE